MIPIHAVPNRIRRSIGVALILLATGAAGCGRSDPLPDGLVLIVIDTLRGDRLGVSGYAPAQTPTLDSLAAVGTRFAAADTPVPLTLPAVASLLTGRYPFHHGIRNNDGFVLDAAEETLAEQFQRAGYRTGAVLASGVLAADRGLTQGFTRYDDAFTGPYPVYTPSLEPLAEEFARTRRRADTVTDLALEQLAGFGPDRFFLLVHYFDVHMHYDPPPAFAARHPGRPYDGETAFVDAEIGRLLAAVRRDRPRALVVVVSDHGESQNEHGEPQHGFLVYQSTLQVVWIAAGPGVPAGTVRKDPVSLIDVAPTLTRVFRLPEPESPGDGRALDWGIPEPEPVPLYAETFHSLLSLDWRELRALRRERFKVIAGPPVELYDLESDPGEQHDLGPVDPAPELLAILEALTAGDDAEEVYRTARGGADPERRELLESLGYVGGGSSAPRPRPTRPHPRDALPGWLRHQWAKELLRLGGSRLAAGDPATARALADSVLRLDPDLPGAHVLDGVLLAAAGRPGPAEAAYRRALELEPENLGGLTGLAELSEAAARPPEAFERWTQVFLVDPDQAPALAFLSRWYMDRDQPDSALPYLRRLVTGNPEDPTARFNLALAAYRAGRTDEAATHFEAFKELAPEAPQIPEVDRLLGTLYSLPTRAPAGTPP